MRVERCGTAVRPIAQQPWKLTSIIWPTVLAAILPIGLHELLKRLPRLVARLGAFDDARRPRQVTQYRDRFHFETDEGSLCNC